MLKLLEVLGNFYRQSETFYPTLKRFKGHFPKIIGRVAIFGSPKPSAKNGRIAETLEISTIKRRTTHCINA